MRFPAEAAIVSVIAAGVVAVLGTVVYKRFRRPIDREAYRRAVLEREGRIVEGMVHDFREGVAYYSWSWRGVVYESAQDVQALMHLLPGETNLLIGPAGVRFLPRDPANSIVLSENWNGFRMYSSKA